MDNLYIALGMATFWMMVFIASLAVALTIWEALGAAIHTFRVLKALDWEADNGDKLRFKGSYAFWKAQFIGVRIWAFGIKRKPGTIVFYPWPWLSIKGRKPYQEEYDGRQRGC